MPRTYTLYHPDGRSQSNIYHSELATWIAYGWLTEQPTQEQPNAIPKEETKAPQVNLRDEREVELKAMDWRALKAIAEQHGIDKPDDGWDEAIPFILDVEFGG
ncbi:MAG: hypothetical protein AAFU78_21110 [Cyanobacteria bacterium J06633_2]